MAGRQFLTVADELIGAANALADHLEGHGYRVRVEQGELDYPYTPALECIRDRTTMFVEMLGHLDFPRLGDWVRYGRSCTRDTRVAVCVPMSVTVSADDLRMLRSLQVGLYQARTGVVIEVLPAMDLALNVSLPDLSTLNPKVRRLLGPVYEKFDRSDWRDGFKAACQLVEVEARAYLIRGVKSGRVTFLDARGRRYTLPERRISRMPIGPLAGAFREIEKQNHADSVIGGVLELINPDRVGATHRERLGRTESRLRANVGRHMYRLIAALKELVDVP